MDKEKGLSTQSVHLGCRFDPATGSIVTPLSQNSAFAYGDLDQWRAVSLKEVPGDIYIGGARGPSRMGFIRAPVF